jgi:hypothetical protein
VVVVADAGMLSAANLVALEEAGFGFIVGSRPSSAVDDLADHFRRHGNYFTEGQTVEAGTPIRQDHRGGQGRGLGAGRAGPLPGRVEGLRHQFDADTMDGQQVVAAYRDLYQVERSFRMANPTSPRGRCSTASATASKPT